MIKVELIEHIFKAACISRWNDYPRMANLVELDKQAHKFIIAYLLAKQEDDVNMQVVLEGGIFEFLSRVVVTDIRPDVYHEMIKQKKDEINAWVLSKIEPMVCDVDEGGFLQRFQAYLQKNDFQKERLILKAASYLATKWEFNIVYQTSKFLNDIDEIKAKVDEELEDYYELVGVRKIALNQKLAKLIDLSGRLRFQKRWAQTPRIPETAVLGHMLVVAILSYFYSLKVKACDKRLQSNFYCALFHDLPESLTRDIISPVKYGIGGLHSLISEYEMKLIESKILPLIPASFKDEFAYLLGIRKDENGLLIKDEFENRTFKDKNIRVCSASLKEFNSDEYAAIDGKALKSCDRLAAFIEAALSIHHGLSSNELKQGLKDIYNKFSENHSVDGVNFFSMCEKILQYFKITL
ncbi:HD family hydrolase, possible ComGF family competence protein [Campylobacter avium LMG 24591]|uniref:HD family hydrolase, possible ComGF family competence protein n=1 Tax=Campylobacter avium LMG 24591 TaxID=522484 RepID=A0A222MW98_9BACT|nr:HD domain-containing protein [Campylobacter avium]ASQ29928.1 HD family hydrolase, possible ComGF family competence protein [Campylobacter avium LMG 24591]OYD79027.1 HD family hydrolase, possible ComGF family competence protein [Campylobacter avium]HJE66097.1 HD family hydrolase [Campylobacter avium]